MALILLVQYVTQSDVSAFSFFLNSSVAASISVLGIFSAVTFIDFVVKRKFISLMPIAAIVLFLAVADRTKISYLSEPLFPWDFIFINQVFALLPVLVKNRPGLFSAVLLGISVGLVCIVYATYKLYKRKKNHRPSRILGLLGFCGLVVFALISRPYESVNLRSYFGINSTIWVQTENYRNNGFLLAFFLNSVDAKTAFIKKPVITDKNLLIEIYKDQGPADAEKVIEPYDIVVIMSEAFWDPTQLPRVHFSADPLPTVRAFSGGQVFSPNQGGGTANVEFEALTGFSNAFLPDGSWPYQQYIKSNFPSWMWVLKKNGYHTVALHPYQKWFWNRENVYKYLGFDSFKAIDSMPGLATRGPFVSDDALTDKIIEQLDDATQPTAIFAISMQNHGPYETARYPGKNRIEVESSGLDGAQALLTYTKGVEDADAALHKLMGNLKARPRPTLLIFFGDHTPLLGDNNSVYHQAGYVGEDFKNLDLDDFKKIRSVPLLVWSSQTGMQKNIGTISPALIPNLIFNQLGISHSYYGGLLGKVSSRYRVIEERVLSDVDDRWIDHWQSQDQSDSPAFDRHGGGAELDFYQAIQYDLMFGDKVTQPLFFPEIPINHK